MSENSTEATTPAKAAKDPVLDCREGDKAVAIELGMRVRLESERDLVDGKKPEGTVTGIEYQRKRVVVKLDNQEKLVVRPASKVWVLKNTSGKIMRVERAVKAGRKAKAEAPAAPAPAEAPADNGAEAPAAS